MLTLTAIVLTGMLQTARPAQQSTMVCLHEPGSETAEQADRRTAALKLTRGINTAESVRSARLGSYGTLEDMVSGGLLNPAPASGEYVPGFKVRLDVMDRGYWFSVTDTVDPCGFRYISNQDGLIFNAEPIR